VKSDNRASFSRLKKKEASRRSFILLQFKDLRVKHPARKRAMGGTKKGPERERGKRKEFQNLREELQTPKKKAVICMKKCPMK